MKRNTRLVIEPSDKKLRLIIINNNQEIACRKEFRNKIIDFLEKENEWLFKGRLQLRKNNNLVEVYFKKALVDCISIPLFTKMLEVEVVR